MTKRLLLALAAAATAAVAAGNASAETSRTPVANGCPAGFEFILVEQAEAQGYVPIPRLVDESGNANGAVCRRALGDGIFHSFPGRPDTVYWWADDDLPDVIP
jgi:ABC-type nitrate/sulfonate/bicarbonate transport system substrate-binding protein